MLVADSFDALDSGALDTISDSLDTMDNPLITWFAQVDTGTIASCVITMQCSPDDVVWEDTTNTLTFADETNQFDPNLTVGARFIRAKITTKSAIASTVNIQINAKS